MSPIQDAIAAINALVPGEKFQYATIARKFGCDCMTLTRRHQGTQGTTTSKNLKQLRLTPQQEKELVTYIEGLTERHLQPTREMMANFALGIGKIEVSETWVTRFLSRHRDVLTNRWNAPMAAEHHAANSYEKYRAHFDKMQQKIEEWNVEPENTYNMDEKGFMAGVIGML